MYTSYVDICSIVLYADRKLMLLTSMLALSVVGKLYFLSLPQIFASKYKHLSQVMNKTATTTSW